MSKVKLIDADIIVEKYKKKIERINGRIEILEKNKAASVYDLTPKILRLQDRIEEYLSLIDEIENAETVDAEPIVRCRDCEWWEKQEASIQGRCVLSGTYPSGSWYCANAKKSKGAE